MLRFEASNPGRDPLKAPEPSVWKQSYGWPRYGWGHSSASTKQISNRTLGSPRCYHLAREDIPWRMVLPDRSPPSDRHELFAPHGSVHVGRGDQRLVSDQRGNHAFRPVLFLPLNLGLGLWAPIYFLSMDAMLVRIDRDMPLAHRPSPTWTRRLGSIDGQPSQVPPGNEGFGIVSPRDAPRGISLDDLLGGIWGKTRACCVPSPLPLIHGNTSFSLQLRVGPHGRTNRRRWKHAEVNSNQWVRKELVGGAPADGAADDRGRRKATEVDVQLHLTWGEG